MKEGKRKQFKSILESSKDSAQISSIISSLTSEKEKFEFLIVVMEELIARKVQGPEIN